MNLRYMSPTLAAYVGESVLLRYDPRDLGEFRVFYKDQFVCRAICQELSGQTVGLRDIERARRGRKQELRKTLIEREQTVNSLIKARRWSTEEDKPEVPKEPPAPPRKLRRYLND